MKYIFLCIFFGVIQLGFAQNQKMISGKVTDIENIAIPYVTIHTTNGKGLISDEGGHFVIHNISDSLTFSVVGFMSQKVASKDLGKESHIILERRVFELAAVKITNIQSSWLGFTNQKNTIESRYQGSNHGAESGIRIQNTKEVSGILTKIKVRVGFIGKPKLPYRINVYSLNEKGYPDENILKKDIIFIPKSKKIKVYNFDIEEQQIEIPKNGVCISLEFLKPSSGTPELNSKYTPKHLGFFDTDYRHLVRNVETEGWFVGNASIPAISLEIKY